jgi:hypothetical protein
MVFRRLCQSTCPMIFRIIHRTVKTHQISVGFPQTVSKYPPNDFSYYSPNCQNSPNFCWFSSDCVKVPAQWFFVLFNELSRRTKFQPVFLRLCQNTQTMIFYYLPNFQNARKISQLYAERRDGAIFAMKWSFFRKSNCPNERPEWSVAEWSGEKKGDCLNKLCVVVWMERSGMNTITPLKKNEKNETEQCKNRDRPK